MAMTMNVEQRCQCGFTQDQIASSAFQCFLDSLQAVTYRAVLHGTVNASSSDIISHIEQWISEGVSISIQNVLISIDTKCVLEIASNQDEECSAVRSSDQIATIVGSTVSIVLILLLIATCSVLVALILKRTRRGQFTINNPR